MFDFSCNHRCKPLPRTATLLRQVPAPVALLLSTIFFTACEPEDVAPVASSTSSTSSGQPDNSTSTTGQESAPSSSDEGAATTGAQTSEGSTTNTDSSSSSTEETQDSNTDSSSSNSDESLDSDTGSGSSTQEPAPGDPKAPKFWIPPDTELCGSIRWTIKDFGVAFSRRHKIKLKSGSFPLDTIRLAGSIYHDDISGSFESETLVPEASGLGTQYAELLLDPTKLDFGNGREISLRFELTANEDEYFQTFVLDSQRHVPITRLNRLNASSEKKVDLFGGALGAAYGPCQIDNAKTEIFHVEFENGDFADFYTRTRHHEYQLPKSQHGVTLRAKGKIGKVSFDVTNWEDLLYGSKELTDSLRIPSLGVRFPEQEGLCGLGLKREPSDEDLPYRAELLNCELKVKEKRKPSAVRYPKRFGVS